ncbi:hypothetical protein, partial [Mesorhizobium sp. M4A.F.Ca.ET.022.05.2.1]|uniref:hypothetical protein n=1 Tax=Mesorhizobium sp. M4A.F.Ca.ET.022.05.2.1 TaxID=2496653 RepID=UPI001AECF85A
MPSNTLIRLGAAHRSTFSHKGRREGCDNRSIAANAPPVYVGPHERHHFTPERLGRPRQPDAFRRA